MSYEFFLILVSLEDLSTHKAAKVSTSEVEALYSSDIGIIEKEMALYGAIFEESWILLHRINRVSAIPTNSLNPDVATLGVEIEKTLGSNFAMLTDTPPSNLGIGVLQKGKHLVGTKRQAG